MRVDPLLLNTVMFLCQEDLDPSGILQKVPRATAFLIRIKDGALTWKYLVTARHNIERAHDPLFVRYNKKAGGFDHFETQKNDWIKSDDSASLGLDRDHAEPLTVADAAVAIGRHDRATLVPKGDGSNTFPSDRRNQRIAGETRHPFDPFLFQDLGDVVDPVHCLLLSTSPILSIRPS